MASIFAHPGTTIGLRNNTIDVLGYGTGILLTNVAGAQIADNTIQVAGDNEGGAWRCAQRCWRSRELDEQYALTGTAGAVPMLLIEVSNATSANRQPRTRF